MSNLTFHFDARATRVVIDSSLLSAGKLAICLLQLPSAVQAIDGDFGRPIAVNALRDLLIGGPGHSDPALQHMLPGVEPVVVITPEYAFGSGDWNAVDAIVRAMSRPAVLLAGFGATPGHVILDWHDAVESSGTSRHLAWRETDGKISGLRRVNGGWCWIHTPGGTTHCIVHLKNVLEQAVEAVELADLQGGRTIVQLEFSDVDLFPLICADLLQPAAQDAESPQGRVRQQLDATPAGRPALVVGSLLQRGFNVNWATAVNSLLNTVLVGRPGAVALCNIAHDSPLADEFQDKWRSLSGVYVPFDVLPKGQQNLPAARALNDLGIAGAVVRHTHACATTGLLSWGPFTPVSGQFAWHGDMTCRVGTGGLVAPIKIVPKPAACEIARFLRRHPPGVGSAPRLQEGIELLIAQLDGDTAPAPGALLDQTLGGVDGVRKVDPDRLHEGEVTSAFRAGMQSLAALKAIHGVGWQPNANFTGQLQIEAQQKHLLIWRSPDKSPRAMQRDLATWRLQPGDHPNLIVLGAGPNGDLADAEIAEDRRDDISLAPAPDTQLAVGGSLAPQHGDITTARARRRVAGLGLAHVAEIYADYDATSDAQRVALLLKRIDAFFSEEATK